MMRRKLFWMVVAIAGPEFVLTFASAQWGTARDSVMAFRASNYPVNYATWLPPHISRLRAIPGDLTSHTLFGHSQLPGVSRGQQTRNDGQIQTRYDSEGGDLFPNHLPCPSIDCSREPTTTDHHDGALCFGDCCLLHHDSQLLVAQACRYSDTYKDPIERERHHIPHQRTPIKTSFDGMEANPLGFHR